MAISSADQQVTALVERRQVPVRAGMRAARACIVDIGQRGAGDGPGGRAGRILPDRAARRPAAVGRRGAVCDNATIRAVDCADRCRSRPCVVRVRDSSPRHRSLLCPAAGRAAAGCSRTADQPTPGGRRQATDAGARSPPADIPMRADADERFAQDVIAAQAAGPDRRSSGRARTHLAGVGHALEAAFKRDELQQLLGRSRLESLERHWKFYEQATRRPGAAISSGRAASTPRMQPNSRSAAPCGRRPAHRSSRRRGTGAGRSRAQRDLAQIARPSRRSPARSTSRSARPARQRCSRDIDCRPEGGRRRHRLLRPAASP